MFRLFIFFSVLISVLNEIYFSNMEELEAPKADKKEMLRSFYAQICGDIDLSGFNIGNRPQAMKLGYDKGLKVSIPDSCVPFMEGQISEQCHSDVQALEEKYHKDAGRLTELHKQTNAALEYFSKQPYLSDALNELELSDDIRVKLSNKLLLRNSYFVGYVYSQLNNLGNCGPIAARTLYEFSRKAKFDRLSLVTVSQDRTGKKGNFDDIGPSVRDHTFFVIGGSAAAGKYKGFAFRDGIVPDALLEGWICDPWRRDVKFGTVRELTNNDPLYNWTNWDNFEIGDVRLPKLSTGSDISWFEKIDFMSNSDLFFDLFFAEKKLWKNAIVDQKGLVSESQIRKKIEAVLLPPEDDQLPIMHPEL